MSEFGDAFSAVFEAMGSIGAGNTIRFNGIEKPCVATEIEKKKVTRDTGYDIISNPSCEMRRADFAALNVTEDQRVTIDGFPLVFKGTIGDANLPVLTLSFSHQV